MPSELLRLLLGVVDISDRSSEGLAAPGVFCCSLSSVLEILVSISDNLALTEVKAVRMSLFISPCPEAPMTLESVSLLTSFMN